MTTIPLICDEPPGRITVISVPGRISQDTAARIQAAFREAMATGRPIVLDESVSISQIDVGRGGWPDSEFCAA